MAVSKPINSGYNVVMGSGTGSNGNRIEVWAEWKESNISIPNNTSSVTVKLYASAVSSSSTWSGSGGGKSYITINGTEYTISTSVNYDFRDVGHVNSFGSKTVNGIQHNANGTKSIVLGGRFTTSSSYITGGSVSKTVALETIPQYATITQTLSSKTETSITMKWSTDQTVDYVWYSRDNGSTWNAIGSANATTGTYTITGLSVGTTYQIKTRVRNKSSQLTSDSSASSIATYYYPYCSSMPNFNLGDNVTLGFYNPLGRTFHFAIIGADNTEITYPSWEISGTSYTGLSSMTSTVPALYDTIKNASNGVYKIKVTYGSHITTKTGGRYYAKASDCSPAIGSFTYADVNSTSVAITEDASKIVRNISTVRYTVGSLTTMYGATVSSVSVKVNNISYALSLSGSNYVGGNASIDSGSNVTAVATVTDSRGFTATKNVTITMLDWVQPSALISLARQNNYYSETDITVDAIYSSIGGKNQITITYKAKKQGTSTWTVTGTLQDNVQSTFTADNQYVWDVQVVLVDSFGGTTTYNLTITRGMPLIFFDRLRTSVGVNCIPNANNSLQNNGYDLDYDADVMTYESGWEDYQTGSTPVVRRQGRVVYMRGIVKPTATTTLGTTSVKIGTIPTGYRPSELVYQLCQGSGTSIYFLQINSSGEVFIGRLRDVANSNGTYTDGTTSAYSWFPFSVSWII